MTPKEGASINDLWLGSWSVRGIKNASLRLKRSWALRWKNSQALSFPWENFPFPQSGLSNLATLSYTTVRSRKMKVLAFEFFHLWATSFQPQGTYILRCSFRKLSLWHPTEFPKGKKIIGSHARLRDFLWFSKWPCSKCVGSKIGHPLWRPTFHN